MTIKLEKKTYQCHDGVINESLVLTVMHDGEEYELDSFCDEDGDDVYLLEDGTYENHFGDEVDEPYGFKLVETTYKGREDMELVSKIKKLSEHPEAQYRTGTDEDGDYYWVVYFKTPA